MPVTEEAPIHPESVYAETKAMVEQILGWYDVTDGLRSVSLRYFNAAGASADGHFGEVWDRSINLVPVAMKADARPPPGRSRCSATTTPRPTARASATTSTSTTSPTPTSRRSSYLADGGPTIALNVGTGVGSSVLEVLAATERVAGRPVPHEIARAAPAIRSPPTPTRRSIGTTLGWRATKDLDDIIASAWAWHSSHPDGYASA